MTHARVLVVGGGLTGMVAGLRMRRERPQTEVIVVEALPTAGGDIRTQRSNGFVCELGAFALTDEELQPALTVLERPPKLVAMRESAREGWLFDGTSKHGIAVEPEPHSFASGCEELAQALRRELGASLRLGRAVTSIAPASDGFTVELGGEVPTQLAVDEIVFAVSPITAAHLLTSFDPQIVEVVKHAQQQMRAFVFLGGLAKQNADLQGYGMIAQPGFESPIAELIFCTNVFERRALADRFMMRAEITLSEWPDSDDEVARLAEQEARRWTGTEAPFGFTKVHRFTTDCHDGVEVECRARFIELMQRVAGMSRAN